MVKVEFRINSRIFLFLGFKGFFNVMNLMLMLNFYLV